MFRDAQESHRHALQTLNTLYEFDDFMLSIGTLCDMGCGEGLDLAWWAGRTTRELDNPKPLDIKCTGVDLVNRSKTIENLRGVRYIQQDFEKELPIGPRRFDVIWCHDAFQYATNPLNTLRLWNEQINTNGMLYICVPMHINNVQGRWSMEAWNQEYFSWTPLSLIYALAVNGFDMRDAYMYKAPSDPWLHAVVFKSNLEPMDPKTTTWHDLSSAGLLHDTVMASIQTFGRPVQNHIVYPWLDHENHYFSA